MFALYPEDDENAKMGATQRQAIILGGCHVAGYGLGGAAPFWAGAVRRWGAEKIDCRANVSVNRALKIARELAPLPPGTLVILQLGHYDLHAQISPLNPVTPNLAKSKKSKNSSERDSNKDIDFNKYVSRLDFLISFFRGSLLFTLDAVFVSKDRIKKEIDEISAQFDLLLKYLKQEGAEKIVVLANFPTCSPRANRRRILFSNLMRRITKSNDHVFVDLDWKNFSIGYGYFSLLRKEVALDADHLNAHGHSVIGKILDAHEI